MTVLLTVFIGFPTFIISLISTKNFKKSLLRMMAISALGILLDLSLIIMALSC